MKLLVTFVLALVPVVMAQIDTCPSRACPAYYWKRFKGKCYLFVPCEGCTPLSSRKECRKRGAIQAKITSKERHDFIVTNKRGETISVGAHMTNAWRWEDGTPLEYYNWHPNGHDRHADQRCITLGSKKYPGNYDWTDELCDIPVNGYVCEKEEFGCEEGWTRHGDRCYRPFELAETKWMADTQRAKCRVLGGDLANANTPEIEQFLMELVDFASRSLWFRTSGYMVRIDRVLLGGDGCPDDGSYRWMFDGTPFTYANWEPNEPRFSGPDYGRQMCLVMRMKSKAWSVTGCNSRNQLRLGYSDAFICEKRV